MEVTITTKYQITVFLSVIFLVTVNSVSPVGEWTVKNNAGDICMKMQMRATFVIPYKTTTGQDTAVVDVPTTADTSYSKCEGDSVSFELKFFYSSWSLNLDYKKSGTKYKLDTIGVMYTIDGHFPGSTDSGWNSGSITGSNLPKTDVGNYYGCDNITYDVSGVDLVLSDVKFQPYVQDVVDKGYGQLQVCTTDNGLSQVEAILIIVAVALVIIVPIVVTVVCVVRRKRKNRQFDYQWQ